MARFTRRRLLYWAGSTITGTLFATVLITSLRLLRTPVTIAIRLGRSRALSVSVVVCPKPT